MVRTIAGGLLVQDRDAADIDHMSLDVVTRRAPSAAEMADLKLAYRVCKHVKSNAIVLAKGGVRIAGPDAVDVFYDGSTLEVLATPKIGEHAVSGAGCSLAAAVTAELSARGALVPDYVAIVEPATLEPVAHAAPGTLVMVAARVGPTRLLDTVVLGDPRYGTGLARGAGLAGVGAAAA